MTKWRLYISGMQLAEFTQFGEEVRIREAGAATNQKLAAKQAEELAKQMHFNPLTTLQ